MNPELAALVEESKQNGLEALEMLAKKQVAVAMKAIDVIVAGTENKIDDMVVAALKSQVEAVLMSLAEGIKK